jgi:hypothetical protein
MSARLPRLKILRVAGIGAVLALAAAGPLRAQGTNAAAAPPELDELSRRYRSVLSEIFARYRETTAAYPKQYESDLKSLKDRLQKAGDLEGLLAAAREQQRFAKAVSAERDPFELVPEMPPDALVSAPADLRAMQELYQKRHADANTARQKEMSDLTTKYLARLEALQRELTIKNRIRDAVAVKLESERIGKGAADDKIVALAESLIRENGGATPPPAGAGRDTGEIPVYDRTPPWARWEFERRYAFAREGSLFGHPDIPDELSVDFTPRLGRGRITGRCFVERAVVDMRDRSWFGKALVWRISGATNLQATIELESREISAGENSGPHAQLALFSDRTLLKALNVPLMSRVATLKIGVTPDGSRCTLSWKEGKSTETVDLPEKGTLRLLLGVALHNAGEMCDTGIALQY